MKSHALRNRQSGFILVVVLGLVLLLAAFLFAFNHTALTKLEAAESFQGFEQAWNCARAGLSIAVAAVRDANDFSNDPHLAKLRTGQAEFPVGEGTCSIRIAGESGRLNINRLKDKDGRLDRTRIEQLLRLIDLVNRQNPDSQRIGYGLAPALIDWTDNDDEVTQLPFIGRDNHGAENHHYSQLTPAYRCKNRPMDTIEELRWVKGVTPEAFKRLRDLLTTTGDGLININTAPKPMLECLSEQMDPILSRMIVERRELKPFKNVAELKDVPGMTDNVYREIKDTITTSPTEQHYRVCSHGKAGEQICKIEALLRRNTRTGNVDIILYRES